MLRQVDHKFKVRLGGILKLITNKQMNPRVRKIGMEERNELF